MIEAMLKKEGFRELTEEEKNSPMYADSIRASRELFDKDNKKIKSRS